MRLPTALSLILAGILIAGSAWMRIGRADTNGNHLVTVTGPQVTSTALTPDEQKLEEIYTSTATSTTNGTTTEELTDTDLITRQMLSDYVSLSANGQATQANLDALGDQYATNIINLSGASSIMATDLTSTVNTKENMQGYANAFAAIYGKYISLQSAAVQGKNIDPNGDFNTTSAALSAKLGDLYQEEADELKKLPVPTALIKDHTNIVNRYLRDAWDMHAIANLNTNSTDASAALASQNNAYTDEQNILTDIEKILRSNGIISVTS